MKRSILVLVLLLLGAVLLVACSPTASTPSETNAGESPSQATETAPPTAVAAEAPATTSEEFNWRMHEGTNLRIAMARQPWTEFLEPYIAEFEALTGIRTTYEILPEDQFRQKTTVEFTAGTSDVDLFVSMLAQEGIKYETAGWYADIGAMAANPAITDPIFDLSDFTDAGMLIGTLDNGKLVGLPVYVETGVLFYNKDLFDQAGVAYPPVTLEDVEAAAAAIHDPDAGIYGVCFRGRGAAATSQFASFMHTHGTSWAKDGQAQITSPAFLDAVKWYGGMLNQYGPPGATSYHWQQCQDIFVQGKAGMWFDGSVFFANLVDSEMSQVVDVVGMAEAPVGPAGPDPTVAGWVLSIYEGSQNKDAAWLFVQWALGKEMVEKAQLNNIATARTSAWEAEAFQAQNAYPEVAEVILKQLSIGNPNWNPPVLNVGEARDAIGALIIEAIDGGNVDAMAPNVNNILQGLLDETPSLPES